MKSIIHFCRLRSIQAAFLFFSTSMLLTCAVLKSLESPLVTDSYPTERTGFTDVRPNIFLKFDKEMNHEATQNAFSMTSDSPVPKGAFEWSGNIMYYRLESDLEYGGRYTIKLSPSAQAKDESKYLTTFLAHFYAGDDLVPSQVISTAPVNLDMLVPLNTPININFSRPMSVTETEAAFQLSPAVAGLFTWNAGNTTLTYTPFQGLTFNQLYTVTIAKTAKDNRGMPLLSDHVFRFKAGTDFTNPIVSSVTSTAPTTIYLPVVPAPTTLVEKTDSFIVSFSKGMDYVATQSAFSITDGLFGSTVAGSFTWIGGYLGFTFKPMSPLVPGRAYYLRITVSAKDTFGNPLLTEAFNSFTVNGPNSQYLAITDVRTIGACATDSNVINMGGTDQFDINLPLVSNQLDFTSLTPWSCTVRFTFSAAVAIGSVPDNVSITRVLGDDAALPGAITNFSWSGGNTIYDLSIGSLGNNDYKIKFIGTSAGIRDINNNFLQSDFVLAFRSQ